MAKLTFALEDGQEVIVPLTERITLGRDEDNDVVVNDEQFALRHAEILPHTSGGFEVRDLGSTTGTFVNGHRIESCRLTQGDRLDFGPLTAVLDLEPFATPPGPAGKAAPSAESIEVAEKQLADWQTAIRQAEAAHEQLLTAIADLTRQHDEKVAALQQLGTDITTAQEKLAALSTRQQEVATRLQQLQHDATQAQTRLSDLDHRHQEGQTRLTDQKEQISIAEGRLAKAQASLQDTEKQQATLTATISVLVQDQQQRETSLRKIVTELQNTETQLTTCRRELTTETRLLEAAQRRRIDLEKQSQPPAPQQPPAPSPDPVPAQRGSRIVAIESPRFTVIPMKSEHVVKRTGDTPPRKGD